jgi:hypothetical protein
MPFKTMSAPVKPVVKPVVSPPAPPAPVWQRLELPANCTSFDTNQFSAHAGAIVTSYLGTRTLNETTYGLGYVNIVPPVGTTWKEQNLKAGVYCDTGVTFNGNMALTLDGGVGPAKLMRYLKL